MSEIEVKEKTPVRELLDLIFSDFKDKQDDEKWTIGVKASFFLFLTEFHNEELLEFLKERNIDVDKLEDDVCEYMSTILEDDPEDDLEDNSEEEYY